MKMEPFLRKKSFFFVQRPSIISVTVLKKKIVIVVGN